MKLRFFIITFVLGFIFITLKAQEPVEVVVSQQKITENGMTFWVHTVEPGQTLYRISLAYKVSINEIIKYNPEATEVLKVGQQLKIPSKPSELSPYNPNNFIYHITKAGESLQSIANIYGVPIEGIETLNPGVGTQPLPADQIIKIPLDYSALLKTQQLPDTNHYASTKEGFITYKVSEKETLYSISRKFGVTIADIIEWNPQVKEGLKIGQELQIGKPGIKPQERGFIEYKVQKQESLYGIARKNRISIDSLKMFNQGLTENIKEGQIILIPKRRATSYITHIAEPKENLQKIANKYEVGEEDLKKANPNIDKKIAESTPIKIPIQALEPQETEVVQPAAEIETMPFTAVCTPTYRFKNEEFKVAVIMPFMLKASSNFPSHHTAYSKKSGELAAFKYLPFYEGMLVALDSLQKIGLRAKIFVYDLGSDLEETQRLLQKPELKSMDLIISLAFSKNFDLIADFAKRNKIPTVNAVSKRDEIISNNEYIIKPYPSEDFQPEAVVQFLSSKSGKQNIIILRNNKNLFKNYTDKLLTLLQRHLEEGHFAEGTTIRFLDDSLSRVKSAIIPGYSNYLIVFSENEAFNINLLRNLSTLNDTLRFSLIGLPLWADMKNAEISALIENDVHFLTPYIVDYYDENVQNFLYCYRERFMAEPDELAFAGFDITWYFGHALMNYGKDFRDCLPFLHLSGIQSNYSFKWLKPNGLVNSFWNIYQYIGYRPVIVNR